MKHFITGFLLAICLSTGLCAGIVYFNNIPLCALKPLDACKTTSTDAYKEEQKRLADLLDQAGIEGANLEERINTLISNGKTRLSALKETVEKMATQFNSQPITDSNHALVAANQKLLTLKEKVNELKELLCAHTDVATNPGYCPM